MKEVELFFEAIRIKDHDTLKRLLVANPKLVNTKDSRGFTPLIFATMYNQEKSVRLLLEKGADTTIQDNESKTALNYASEKGFQSIVDLLK